MILVCDNCKAHLGKKSEATEKMDKCPFCNSNDLCYQIQLDDAMEYRDSIKGKSSKMPGKRKASSEFIAGQERYISNGKFVEKIRKIDRSNNIYYEKVVDVQTKEIIHECSEPLSNHIGHGSDKYKK